MKIFKDAKGRSWEITINVRQVRLVRDILNVDLYQSFSDEMAVYNKITGDIALFVDVLFVLCRDQAKAAGVSDEDFGTGMGGDSLEFALTAFSDELCNFFPGRSRRALQSLMNMSRAVTAELQAAMTMAIESLKPQAIAHSVMKSIPTPSSIELQEPSALIPDVLPSAS